MVSFTNLQYFHSIFDERFSYLGMFKRLYDIFLALPFIVYLYDIYFINFSVQVITVIEVSRLIHRL
ncbi:hypothetical protein KUTeg_023616 [Tegillarca granosa]|uniref:Uncharacterized protein n=1 Tax=Tegillarca granosa TaxID=220873 RepID=A0ABQ9E268_TEGGR|nr:hypothetical protein KUTeg_023616 [Tegillarca granosa]